MRLGERLDGHLVQGHVDAVGCVAARDDQADGSAVMSITAPGSITRYVVEKGSITVDGVSLTVNEVTDQSDGTCHFSLNIIPHTAEVTTLGALKAGDAVNLEIDVLARYLQRMQSLRS